MDASSRTPEVTEYRKPEMVDILQEGLMLKFNIQNLKKDFQNILDGVDKDSEIFIKQSSTMHSSKMSSSEFKPIYGTPQKKQRKDVVLVSSDFNDDRVKSDPTGIIVSDQPSSQVQVRTPNNQKVESNERIRRSVYKSHKKRLMARRESGDGAPAEALPNRHQRRSSSYVPLGSIASPMRRLPIKQQLTDAASPFKNTLHFSKMHEAMPDTIDYAKQPRPSPEGLGCNSPSDKPTSRYQKSLPMLSPNIYNSHGHVQNQDSHKGVAKTSKRKAAKKNFPKTPKSTKSLPRRLETISEDQLMQIRLYTKYLESLPCNKELYDLQDSKKQTLESEKANTTFLKDISHISTVSKTSFREQPSSANLKEHHQCSSSFNYPLHSTISYPLHSTIMQHVNTDIDISNVSEADVSSIVSPCVADSKKKMNSSDHSNGQSSSGVDLSDSDKYSSSQERKSTKKFVSLSSAEGINMEKFSYDEGIMSDSDTESEDSFFGQKLPAPITPPNAVKGYYTLTYTPEQQQESDCESSCLSINLDKPDNTPKSCQNINNIITCRCHVHQVHKIRRNAGLRKITSKANFIESALLMESQDGEVAMEVDRSSSQKVQNFSKKNKSHAYNRLNADSMLALESSGEMDSDMKPHICNSIESIGTVERLSVPLHPIKSSKKSRDIVKVTRVDSNCLNLGKLLKVKEKSPDFIEATIVNHTLANPNVTMVAQGCLGFLKKKNKSSSKRKVVSKKDSKVTKYELNAEDKENISRHQRQYVNKIQSNETKTYNSEVFTEGNYSSIIDKDTKRKLSKRMKDFRQTTFTDPQKMLCQTMGHL